MHAILSSLSWKQVVKIPKMCSQITYFNSLAFNPTEIDEDNLMFFSGSIIYFLNPRLFPLF